MKVIDLNQSLCVVFSSAIKKKCPHFVKRDFTTMSSGALSRARWIQSALFHPVPLTLRGVWLFTRAVHKETELLLIYCFTYNLIKLVSFRVLPSTLDTRFLQFWNASWNLFCGMAWRSLIEFSSISSTVWNQRPFSEDFNFGNKIKSAGAKSGEWAAGGQQSSHAS